MQSGAYLDVAQVTLYVFWIFFACLIFYLRREDKREGYPLESTASGGGIQHGFPRMPDDKHYKLSNGHVATLPNHKNDRRDVALAPIAKWPGAPLIPTGDPMRDGVGPGSWADREDVPELAMDNTPAIAPLRLTPATSIESRDADPRGMPVIGADDVVGGVVVDVWVDRAEALVRYLEIEVGTTAAGIPAGAAAVEVTKITTVTVTPAVGQPVSTAVVESVRPVVVGAPPAATRARRVLVPMPFALIDKSKRVINVRALHGAQFAGVPTTRHPDQVTKLEEDKIVGYFGGGMLYASPARQEPLI